MEYFLTGPKLWIRLERLNTDKIFIIGQSTRSRAKLYRRTRLWTWIPADLFAQVRHADPPFRATFGIIPTIR